jgi:hypothetical protein
MATARTVLLDTARGKVAVTPGVIDGEAEYAYTNGQCLALVHELAALSGWPIIVHLARPGDVDWENRMHGRQIKPGEIASGWFYHFVHALVLTPRWDVLDIRGGCNYDDYQILGSQTYGTTALVRVDPATLERAYQDALRNGARPMKQDRATARAFARVVLDEYRRETGL